MCSFIILNTKFRNYKIATRLGNIVTIEHIQNQLIGMHLLSGKHTCVDTYLHAIELEFKNIDNISLQEVYHKGKDTCDNSSPLHPLDKVQESIKQEIKRILLVPDRSSWKAHSLNDVCANICINDDEAEFVMKQSESTNNVKSKYTHHTTKTTIKRKLLENKDYTNG